MCVNFPKCRSDSVKIADSFCLRELPHLPRNLHGLGDPITKNRVGHDFHSFVSESVHIRNNNERRFSLATSTRSFITIISSSADVVDGTISVTSSQPTCATIKLAYCGGLAYMRGICAPADAMLHRTNVVTSATMPSITSAIATNAARYPFPNLLSNSFRIMVSARDVSSLPTFARTPRHSISKSACACSRRNGTVRYGAGAMVCALPVRSCAARRASSVGLPFLSKAKMKS